MKLVTVTMDQWNKHQHEQSLKMSVLNKEPFYKNAENEYLPALNNSMLNVLIQVSNYYRRS